MAKPPPTPPSKDHGVESDTPDAKGSTAEAAEQEEVARRNSSGRPPQSKR